MRFRGPVAAGLALALVAGGFGLWQGLAVARLDEGRVIAEVAAAYVTDVGGAAQVTDCIGLPGSRPGVWIEVICGNDPLRRYEVDRRGRILPARPRGPEA